MTESGRDGESEGESEGEGEKHVISYPNIDFLKLYLQICTQNIVSDFRIFYFHSCFLWLTGYIYWSFIQIISCLLVISKIARLELDSKQLEHEKDVLKHDLIMARR